MKPTLLGARATLKVMHDAPHRGDVGVSVGEWDALTDDGRQMRRWQMTRVFRKPDHIIDFKVDLGPASAFTCGPIMILGSTDWSDPDTVGELWDMAEAERNDNGLLDFLESRRQASTLIPDMVRETEITAEFIKRSPRTTLRVLKDKSNG